MSVSRPGATREEQREQLREVLRHVGERRGEDVLDLGVDGGDDPREVATCAAHVFELLLEERVATLQFVELLERQRVDRAEQPEFAVELAQTTGRTGTFRQLGHLRRLGDGRLDVELTTQRLDRRFEPELRLGLAEFGLAGALAAGIERPLLFGSFPTKAIELDGELADLVALATALFDEHHVLGVDGGPMGLDDHRQCVDDAERPFDVGTLASRGRPSLHVGGEPPLGLGQLLFEQLLTLVQAGVAHLEFGATRRQRRGTTIELGAQLTTRTGRIDLGLLVGLEAGQQRGQLVDPTLLAFDRCTPLVEGAGEPVVLGPQLADLALGPSETFRRGAESGVVGIERTHQIGFGRARRDQRPLGLVERGRCSRQFVRRRVSAARTASSSAAAVAPVLAAPIRHPLRPNRSPAAVTTTASGMGQGGVDRRRDLVDAHRVAEQAVEQLGDPGARRMRVLAHGSADARGSAGDAGRTPRAMTAPLVADVRSASSARRPAPGSSTTTAVSDSPSAASTAGPHPSSISMRSSSVPSTPSTPARRSAPARARAASRASCSASTRAPVVDAASAASARNDRRTSAVSTAAANAVSAASTCSTSVDSIAARRVALGAESRRRFVEHGDSLEQRHGSTLVSSHLVGDPVERRTDRAQLAAHLGGRTRGPIVRLVARPDGGQRRRALLAEPRLVGEQLGGRRFQTVEFGGHCQQLVLEACRLGFEVRHEVGVEQLHTVALQRATAFGEHRGQTPRTLTELFDPHQPVARVALAPRRQLGLDRHHRGVELCQRRLEVALARGAVESCRGQRFELHPPRGDLATGDERLEQVQLGDQGAVPLRRGGLTLERAELTANLAQQVLHPQQVGLGGIEASFGLLLALAELEDAGGLLDDRPCAPRAGR